MLIAALICLQSPIDLSDLPVLDDRALARAEGDWLLGDVQAEARIGRDEAGTTLILDNGLLRREVRMEGNAATVAFDNLMTGAPVLRAVRPEARIVLDGVAYDIGGLVGQPNHAYLDPAWLAAMTPDPGACTVVGFEVVEPVERLVWKRVRHHAPGVAWPPKGVALRLDFEVPERLDVGVSVHYELYDGVPVLAKWLSIRNGRNEPLVVDDFTVDVLAAVEHDSFVETRGGSARSPHIHVEAEYSMGGMTPFNAGRHAVRWLSDPLYSSQVNYERTTPCLLEVGPENKVLRTLRPGGGFESFRSFTCLYDSEDRTRNSLTLARFYRTVAPWSTENPLMMHVRFADEETVHTAIDQCAEVGFEMVILTFGSGFNMEDDSPETLARMKGYADYARAKGVEIGGYSLLSSRRIEPDGDNCINPETGEPGGMIHGGTPALASDWGQRYLATVRRFYEETGFMLLEHDGPYPGNLDAAARPPLQSGVEDSRYVNWSQSADLYRWLRSRGVYINAPDWYYLVGANKCAMGYREVNWSLPRTQQVIHTRQNIYDGTRYKLPAMGWMFVPLTQYHGGGEAATVEPLDEHLEHYELMLASNLGAGVQACYRGPRLFDTDRTRDVVARWVAWFKEHRDILESPIVHSASRRADGRDLDWMLHASPVLPEKGMLLLFNPLDEPVQRELEVDLYYTGLSGAAMAVYANREATELRLNEAQVARVPIFVPARGVASIAFRGPLGANRAAPPEKHEPTEARRELTESLVLEALDGEALFTIVGGIKPVSSGIWKTPLDVDDPDLGAIELVREALAVFRTDKLFADVVTISHEFGGARSAEAVVVDKSALAGTIRKHAEFFGSLGITPSSHPLQVIVTVENLPKLEQLRGYGYLFGYPDYAVDFFVEAEAKRDESGEFVPRDFVKVPTFTPLASFVWAAPKGHEQNEVDRAILEPASEILKAYRSLRVKHIGVNDRDSLGLLRELLLTLN